MVSKELDEIIKRVERLTPDEQLQLLAYLAEKGAKGDEQERPRRRWSEIHGAAPYPLVGEDAQRWVTRSRREADEGREKGLRREPGA